MAKFYEVAQIRTGKPFTTDDGTVLPAKSFMRIAPETKDGKTDVSGLKRLVKEIQKVIDGEKHYAALQLETPQEELKRLLDFDVISEEKYNKRLGDYEPGGPSSFVKRLIKLKTD